MATKKVYLNTAAQIGGKIATALISIFLIKILTGYLDIAGYGLYSKIYNFLSIFAVVADLGLYTIAVREISHHKEDAKEVRKIAGTVLTIRAVMGLAIIALALAVAAVIPGYDTDVAMIGVLIAGVFTFFGLVNSSILSLLQAYLKTEFSFVSTVLGKITTFAAIVLIAYVALPKPFPNPMENSFPYETAAFALVMLAGLLGNVVMTVSLYLYSRRVEKISFVFDRECAMRITKASLPYWAALFLNVVFFKADVVMLSVIEPQAVADTNIALYGVPMKIVEVGMMFGTVFLNSMLPVLTESMKKGVAELEPLVKKAYSLLFFFWAGTALFLAIAAVPVVEFISNANYVADGPSGYDSSDAMRIVAFVFFFFFLSSLFTYLLVAAGEQKRLLKINGIIALANIVGNALVIPTYSFVWAAVVTLVSQVFLLFLTARAAGRAVGAATFFAKETFAVSVLALGSSAICFFVLRDLPSLGNFATVVVAGAAFGVPYLLGGGMLKNLVRS